ncbi:serine/threonine-protein kinase Sgk1 isoform X1 [Tachysurus ichikawai]
MRNPKVSVEKPQAKAFLSPCPKCQDGQDLWYTHFPTSYVCCPYSPGGYYLPHPPSPLCQPCMPGPRDKTKNCKRGDEHARGCFKLQSRCCHWLNLKDRIIQRSRQSEKEKMIYYIIRALLQQPRHLGCHL